MKRDFETHPMQRIKDLLCEWASWAVDKQKTYPTQSAFVTERVQSSNRGTESFYDNAPADIILLDKHIEGLAPGFKRVLGLEYCDKRPTKTKAAVMGIPRQVFAQRVAWIHEQLNFQMFGESDMTK